MIFIISTSYPSYHNYCFGKFARQAVSKPAARGRHGWLAALRRQSPGHVDVAGSGGTILQAQLDLMFIPPRVEVKLSTLSSYF